MEKVERGDGVLLSDLNGDEVDPFDAKAVVFLFVRTDCPISNRYAPTMRRLYEQFAGRGVKFWLVYAQPDGEREAIRAHLKEYRLSASALRDPNHLLVQKAGVQVTPEAAVFGSDGNLLYRGRIDNRYVDLGKARPAPTQHDLQEVLSSIVAGRPVTNANTVAVGCYIR